MYASISAGNHRRTKTLSVLTVRLQSTLVATAMSACGATAIVAQMAVPRSDRELVLSPIWKVVGEGRGMPAADATAAFFLSKRHEVLAVDAATGAIRWRQNTGEPGDTTQGSAVVLAGPTVAVGDYDLFGFDRVSGALRWRFVPTDGYAPGLYLGGASNQTIYTGSAAGRAYAVDQMTGRLRWSALIVDGGQTTVYAPVTDDDIVAVGYTTFTAPATGGVAVIESVSGHVRWRTPFPRPSDISLNTNTGGAPVVTDDSVIAAAGDGEVVAFDRVTGVVRWSIPKLSGVPASLGPTDYDMRPVARIGRTLLVGSLFGYVVAYDLDTRRELWRYDGSQYGSIGLVMTTDDRTVYVPYASIRLVALNASDGSERWGIGDFDAPFIWAAFPLGDRVYVSSSRAGFFAFPWDSLQSAGTRP